MGQVNSITQTDTQQAAANILDNTNQSCAITVDNFEQDLHLKFLNSDVSGGINFTQKAQMNGTAPTGTPSCILSSTINQSLLTQLQNQQNASTNAGLVLGVAIDIDKTTDLTTFQTNVTNAITQKCQVNATDLIKDVTVYANNSTISGGIGFTQDATGPECVLNTVADLQLVAQGKSAQSDVVIAGFNFSWKTLIIIAVIIMVVAVIGVIGLYFVTKSGKKKSKKRRSNGGGGGGGGGRNQEQEYSPVRNQPQYNQNQPQYQPQYNQSQPQYREPEGGMAQPPAPAQSAPPSSSSQFNPQQLMQLVEENPELLAA